MVELRVDRLSVETDGQRLVEDVSFTLAQSELVVLLGPNGAGKSVSLRSALGLEVRTGGMCLLDNADTQTLPPAIRAREITYLPQRQSLAWPARVQDLVALGRFAYGARLGKLAKTDEKIVVAAMSACDVMRLADRRADTLSGGEMARVHCARAFAAQTPLLIADEPVAALDPLHQFRTLELFRTYVAEGGGALLVLHDIALAAKYADRLIFMKDGRIVADGPVEQTLTAERLAEVYGIKAHVEGRNVSLLGAS